MAAETARKFELLERQAQTLMSSFVAAGYEAVAPAMIQPAGVFLDVIGETLRARTYVFTDPDGDELCLRPDLTVPTCRLHLERRAKPDATARYCYNGPAFRFQPSGADTTHPREFRQAGIETFGSKSRKEADADTVATILAALKTTGLACTTLRMGDLGLFRAILDAADIPARWRGRLMHHFWRPDAFRAELKRLATEPQALARNVPKALLAALKQSPAEAEKAVARYLDSEAIELVGVRNVSEITANLADRVADASAPQLKPAIAGLIERYIGVAAPLGSAAGTIRDMTREAGIDISSALDAFEARNTCLSNAGINLKDARFSAEFGRSLEYYTGFVFELVTPSLGSASPVAGGGRYDSLMRAIGAGADIPAVGAAIHTERLLSAVAGGRS